MLLSDVVGGRTEAPAGSGPWLHGSSCLGSCSCPCGTRSSPFRALAFGRLPSLLPLGCEQDSWPPAMDPVPPDISRTQAAMERAQAVMDQINPSSSMNIKLKDISEIRRPTIPYIHPLGIALPPYSSSNRQETVIKSQKPKDYVLWSFFSYLFLNCCCLGFIALIYSFKARDRHIMGDSEHAVAYGRKARSLNSAALIITTFSIMLVIVLLATVSTTHTLTLNQILETIKSYLTY